MNISEVRIRKVEKDDSKLKAVASVTIDNCFVVHDIKIIQGESNLFIAMPSKKIVYTVFILNGQKRIIRIIRTLITTPKGFGVVET